MEHEFCRSTHLRSAHSTQREKKVYAKHSTLRAFTEMMKFAVFAWVAAATAFLVGQVVFGQPTTEEDNCISPAVSARNMARQSTLEDVAQVIREVRDAVVKPSIDTPPLVNTNPVFSLTSKTSAEHIVYFFIL